MTEVVVYSQFKCLNCGSSRLEEIRINVTVATIINSVAEGGDIVYGDQSNADGSVVRYQCTECGFAIRNIRDDLIKDWPINALYDELFRRMIMAKPEEETRVTEN